MIKRMEYKQFHGIPDAQEMSGLCKRLKLSVTRIEQKRGKN